MTDCLHNFSAGPAALPLPVRTALAEALGTDVSPSIAEISHRGARFGAIAEELQARLRALTGIGPEHHIVLLQGGASQQFAQIPMNFAHQHSAGYLITGHWGMKALREARRVGAATVVASAESDGFVDVVDGFSAGSFDGPLAYLHYTGNETIEGVQYADPPSTEWPLVADMSSEFLSRPYPYSRLAVAYAGAQKNLGIAGLTVVLIREDLMARGAEHLPSYFDYRQWVQQGSMLNTPCTVAWFAALETLKWIEAEGGLTVIAARNAEKARRLYAQIDASDFYRNPVVPRARSVMNVPFWLADDTLSTQFVAAAEGEGLLGLKGHRAVGGLRASLYNAIGLEAVEALVAFMKDFEKTYG